MNYYGDVDIPFRGKDQVVKSLRICVPVTRAADDRKPGIGKFYPCRYRDRLPCIA